MNMPVNAMEKGLIRGLGEHSGWTIAIGVLLLVFGFLCLAAPFASGIAVTISVGLLLFAAGIGELVLAFRAGALGRGVLIFLIGLVAMAAGLVLMFQPEAGLISITLLLAAYFVVTGIFAVIAAFRLRPAQGWVWMLANGVVTLVLGLLIWMQWPLSGVWAVGILFGVQLIFTGAALLTVGISVRRVLRHVASSA
jgi:uncharacterized membrane protein HdeD (DUF308 family)